MVAFNLQQAVSDVAVASRCSQRQPFSPLIATQPLLLSAAGSVCHDHVLLIPGTQSRPHPHKASQSPQFNSAAFFYHRTVLVPTCDAVKPARMLKAAINTITAQSPRDPGTPSHPTAICLKSSNGQYELSKASTGTGPGTNDLRNGHGPRRPQGCFKNRPNALRVGLRALLLLLTLPPAKILWNFAAIHDPTIKTFASDLSAIDAMHSFSWSASRPLDLSRRQR